MNLSSTISVYGYGTSEGVQKAWDTRGRSVYHVTHTNLVGKIQKEGLRPMQTSNWVRQGDKQRYGKGEVYAFEHPQDALRWAAKMDWEFNKQTGSGKISLLKVDPAGRTWRVDQSDPLGQASAKGKWLKSDGGIPAKQIQDAKPFTQDLVKHLTHGGKDFKW